MVSASSKATALSDKTRLLLTIRARTATPAVSKTECVVMFFLRIPADWNVSVDFAAASPTSH